MNNKTTITCIIIGGVIAWLILKPQRDKIETKAKQAEKDSIEQVKDMFKNDIPIVKADDFLK
jgi:hypothetical protein